MFRLHSALHSPCSANILIERGEHVLSRMNAQFPVVGPRIADTSGLENIQSLIIATITTMVQNWGNQ